MALLAPDDLARLREALLAADYLIDPVMAAIGPAGQAGLARNHTAAAERALGARDDPLATLIRLFVLQQAQPLSAVQRALDPTAPLAAGLLETTAAGQIRASLDLRPYGDDDGTAGWLVSDHTATLDTARGRPRPDHVLGVSPASISLVQISDRARVGRALDLGAGCGVQSLHLVRRADQVVATDLNRRAIELAQLSFGLSQVEVDLRQGSLFRPVAELTFDRIVTNPPFVISPPGGRRLIYRENSAPGDDLTRQVVRRSVDHLNLGGELSLVGNWAHLSSSDWRERLTDWVPDGCDALIVQRERLSPDHYAEVWLADAGWAGTPSYRRRLDHWLDYLDGLGVAAIGLGWIRLRRSGRVGRSVTVLDWPQPVAQPVADDLTAHLDAAAWADWSDQTVWSTRWVLAADAIQETAGQPGASQPARIWLRRQRGLGRLVEVDTALGGVLGACDGELALGDIVTAVASLTDDDPVALTTRLRPVLRQLIAEAWLTPLTPSA
ncbi:MAG: methyltransferase [Propionibacteriaceae bacterium]|jgi:methylase of polypeptide subunit release factors|nr:methyltransferase [Propionibacteriaceae bacterium]